MIRGSIIRCCIVMSFALSAGGCSWIFLNGPPVGHEERDFFYCTESKTAPVIDAIIGGYTLLKASTIYGYALIDPQVNRFIWAGLFGASAYTGFGRVKRCQSAQLEAARRRAGEDADAAAFASPQPTSGPAPWPTALAPPLRRPSGAGR